MPGDPFKRVSSGDPLAIGAETWNALIDGVIRDRAQQRKHGADDDKRPPWSPGLAYIENTSGDDLDQFAVLGIGDPITAPVDDDGAAIFAEYPAFSGIVPTDDHVLVGKFAILLEPVPNGAIALACIAGSTIFRVNVVAEDDSFADLESGTTDALVSTFNGPIQIIWKESGTGDGKLAVGRWGGRAKPTKKYQVETPIDDTKRPIWTTVRFTDDT
jgi:hypothetical protein